MHFLKGDSVAGVPVERAREVVRELGLLPLPSRVVAARVNASAEQAEEWLSSLADAGFVLVTHGERGPAWTTSASGAALAKATLRRPIMRKTAQRLVERVAARAAEYNRTPDFLCSIERLRVFGSFLDDARDRLGDVDIELTLGPRPTPEAARAFTRRHAPHLTSPFDLVFWPEHQVRQFLADGSRSVDFQDGRTGTLDTPMRVIYERAADPQALAR